MEQRQIEAATDFISLMVTGFIKDAGKALLEKRQISNTKFKTHIGTLTILK